MVYASLAECRSNIASLSAPLTVLALQFLLSRRPIRHVFCNALFLRLWPKQGILLWHLLAEGESPFGVKVDWIRAFVW